MTGFKDSENKLYKHIKKTKSITNMYGNDGMVNH